LYIQNLYFLPWTNNTDAGTSIQLLNSADLRIHLAVCHLSLVTCDFIKFWDFETCCYIPFTSHTLGTTIWSIKFKICISVLVACNRNHVKNALICCSDARYELKQLLNRHRSFTPILSNQGKVSCEWIFHLVLLLLQYTS
jgi:hypothetical protein